MRLLEAGDLGVPLEQDRGRAALEPLREAEAAPRISDLPALVASTAGKIATFKVPRYVRFIDDWPMSGTKIKKAILRDMITADLKDKGITRAPRIETTPHSTSASGRSVAPSS